MPETFGRYELQDLLGRGGMGEVFRAFDTVRDRTVALKLLPKHLATDESFKTRFRRESRMAARLNEPHIIPIHDFGEIDGQLFIDMRLVEGRDLGTLLAERHTLPVGMAVGIVSQVAAALDAAHESGLVHRDVKPSNILLTGMSDEDDANPFAYLVDFGIARADAQEGTALTATTGTMGTVAYLSPERISGGHGDRTTDIYALACVLYEMLTGAKPFEGEMFAILYAHVNTAAPAPSARVAGLPPGLDTVVRRGMAKNPADRYPTAGALAAAARAALRAADRPVAPPPTPPPGTPPPTGPPSPWTSPPPAYTPPPGAPTGPPPTPPPMPPPAGPWSPPTHSGPIGPPGFTGPTPLTQPSPPRDTSRRKAILAVLAVVLVVAAAVIVVVVVHNNGSPSANATTSPPTSPSRSSPQSPVTTPASTTPTLDTGPAGNVVTWANFAAFSKLLGTKDHDTAHAFHGASCAVEGRQSDDPTGIVDQVACTFSTSSVTLYVARFTTATAVQSYVHGLTDGSEPYSVTAWGQDSVARGLSYASPSSPDGVDITTSVCGLPTYLIQFFVKGGTSTTMKSLHDDYWNAATFPDLIPPTCSPDFSGPGTDRSVLDGIVASKPAVDIDDGSLTAYLERGSSSLSAVSVPTSGGSESMVVGQSGKVTFWSYDSSTHTLVRVGSSTYPSSTALGPPSAKGTGTVLSGMSHATFIVTGVFSGDGSGNAVAYTTGAKGWGAIKAQKNGHLAPSGVGIGQDRIGLSEGFAFSAGRLETADCSSTLPISQCGGNKRVLKFWTWNGSQFVLSSRAGLPK